MSPRTQTSFFNKNKKVSKEQTGEGDKKSRNKVPQMLSSQLPLLYAQVLAFNILQLKGYKKPTSVSLLQIKLQRLQSQIDKICQ